MNPRSARLSPWAVAPLALAVLTLLGSVAIPARQTWLITDLLHETTEALEPARLLEARLQSGLAEEVDVLQSFALTGDTALLARYRSGAAEDERRLASLEELATRLGPASAAHVRMVRRRTDDWRRSILATTDPRASRGDVAAALRLAQPRYDECRTSIGALSLALAAEAAARDDRVRALEHVGLASNAALVLAALAALVGVMILTVQQRRLAAELHGRVEEEFALRQLARALSAAVTLDQAMRCTTDAAVAMTKAFGAYGEWKTTRAEQVEIVVGLAGEPARQGMRAPYAGSLVEEITARGNPGGLAEIDAIGAHLAAGSGDACRECAGLVAPLFSADETLGVLVLLREPTAPPFGEGERRQIRLIGDLASAALRRAAGRLRERQALDEAQRRAERELALREAAEALAGAFEMNEVTECIARAALATMGGRGAFVEEIAGGAADSSAVVVVRAVSGVDVPALETTRELSGSYAERVTESHTPLLIEDLADREHAGPVDAWRHAGGTAVVVPLGVPGTPVGALFVLSSADAPFHPDDVARASIFGHLAALAYHKVRLLDEANEGRRQLERVLQSRSHLMRGFSHDVKNPIGAAEGYAELLSAGVYGELSAEQRDVVQRIHGCMQGALSLIDDLHALARAEAGHIELSLDPVDLGELARTVGEQYQAAARAAGLSLTVEVESQLPALHTSGARVRQIAANLLSNAIKYTERGSVTIHALCRSHGPAGEQGDWALLEFTDTGAGIPPDQQELIFEEFSRVGDTTKPGAGLGLAISRLLAQALGGHISVASEPGHGSTFTLWLPLERGDVGEARRVPAMLA